MRKRDTDKLRMWQERLERNQSAYQGEIDKMDGREALYKGDNSIRAIVRDERKKRTPHVRNICAELIESQVDSNIPQPKVTAYRAKDERLAKIIEDMLRNELDRLPFEQLNDMLERTVPIQGGAAFLTEWDNAKTTHFTVGELAVGILHPKQIIPQDGVYTGIEDMDYIILKIPQTKEYINRKYNVSVKDEAEREPDIKGSGEDTASDDLVTQYIAYYRNDNGGIGLYSWVNDTQLEDIEDYQARRLKRCTHCGTVKPSGTSEEQLTALSLPYGEDDAKRSPSSFSDVTRFAGLPSDEKAGRAASLLWTGDALIPKPTPREQGNNACPYCGGTKWEESTEEYEEIITPVMRTDGMPVEGRVPFYKPDIYPVVLQKNVSVYGKFLGDSDLDKISDQQNTINRIEAKIIDKLVSSGSYITLPPNASIRKDSNDMKTIRLDNIQDKQYIGVYDMEGNIEQDAAYLAQIYEEARQIIGITDSFQGRRDATATSGKAKEFAAAQSAGRLESKRMMKDSAYAALFEAMFKFKLAYADEPRPVITHDVHGKTQYETFNRYDFLEKDDAGEWCWNDRFLFSCDTSTPLAANREAMWQETRMNLQTGAFGDPANIKTLILFWTKMEQLHYPGAGETKSYLEEELQKQIQAAQYEAMQMQAMQSSPQGQAPGGAAGMERAVIQRAQQDAARDVMGSR